MQKTDYTIGIRYGLITALIYICLLFCRYSFFASSPTSFSSFAIASFFIILIMYFLTGIARRKQLGGYAEIKEIFQSVFIAILITEAAYIVFNFIYLKYVNPGFVDRFQATALAYYRMENLTAEQISMEMKDVKTLFDAVKPAGLIKGFGITVVVDSIFGFIFAAILRKKKTLPEAPSQV